MAIVTLVLWLITAGAGIALLGASGAARQRAAQPAEAAVPARVGAVPRTAEGKPPPGPQASVGTPPGEHPLLEFSHPALAVAGLACWFMFVLVHYRPMAWIAFGIVLAAIALGLTWLARNARHRKRHPGSTAGFPPRLVLTHGIAAAVTIALTVLTALTASRG